MAHIHRLSKREAELPGARIGELVRLAEEKPGLISLGPGEPDFATPSPIIAQAKRMLDKGYTHYSPAEGRKDFREAVSRKVRKENGIRAGPENIIATAGSTEGILLALACTIDVGEHVIVPDPGFLAYHPAVELLSAVPVALELREEEGFEINADRLRELVEEDTRRARVLILNTPANPTGNVVSRKALEEIADIVIENDLIVISDEAYEKFVYDAEHVSIGSLNGMERHTISLFTMSKSYAMPGWRIGWAVAPEHLAEAMAKLHAYTSLCAPTLSQAAAAWALDNLPASPIERMRKEYDKRRKYIVPRLNGMGLATPEPKGAFYAFSSIKPFHITSNEMVDYLLNKAKVITLPGTEFGKFGEGYIRCSYATELGKIKEAADRMEAALGKL
jgi:aminotransferase